MATGMHVLNVQILDGADQLTHWTGSPSAEGGALTAIDMSPVAGPPQFDYDPTGNYREQEKITLETKIIGTDDAARTAFIARYARGMIFTNPTISGMLTDRDWIVENALVRHNEDGPSVLQITLAELGPTSL